MASSLRVSIFLAGILAVFPVLTSSYLGYQLTLFLIYAIAVQGVGFLWSKTGILPLGQAFFFGLGAYLGAASLLSTENLIVQAVLSLLIFPAVAMIGFVISVMIFRGRSETGPYFSLITLALAMIAEQMANSFQWLTGGFNGLGGYAPLFGLDVYAHIYWLVAAVLVLVTFCLVWLDERPAGIVAAAIADNESRLQLLGYPTHIMKALVFALSAGLAALAGVLFASYQGIVTPTSVGFLLSVEFVIWAAVGGRFHPLGAILGTVVIGMLSVELRDRIALWEVLLAALFLVVVLNTKRGMWGLVERLWNRLRPPHRKEFPTKAAKPVCHAVASSGFRFSDVRLQIGDVRVLNGVNFDSIASGVLAIIGPNGAGKTSLLNAITGNMQLSGGEIVYNGQRIENRPPHMALKAGIGRKLQVPTVFPALSVHNNIVIAGMCARAEIFDYLRADFCHQRSPWFSYLAEKEAYAFLKHAHLPAGHLAQGQRQFLEFMMASLPEPSALLLDEPGAGLSPEETRSMGRLIREYSRRHNGLVVLIEHDMSVVADLSDEVIVMHQGKVLAQGSYQEIKANAEVAAVYLGGSRA